MASSNKAHAIVRPQRVYDFGAFSTRTPTAQQPGDRLDAQFQNLIDATNQLARAVEGMREPLTIDRVDPAFIKDLVNTLRAQIAEDVANAHAAAANAMIDARNVESALAEALAAASASQIAVARAEAVLNQVKEHREAIAAADYARETQPQSRSTPLPNFPLLGPNAGGFYAADVEGATATASDYAQVSIEWAEHMPDIIPPNVLAVTGITGDHWSSRWWANRSANAFGMLAWFYQGAWPDPGPPNTPFTPTNDPLPLGAMYFNTDRDEMMVWNGVVWAPFGAPSPAITSSLFFPTSAGKTAYPTTAADLFGKSYTLKADGSNGIKLYANGVRLTPDDGSLTIGDYAVDAPNSTINLVKALPAGYVLAIDVMVPPAQLQPAATKISKMKPLIFNGSQTSFILQATDGSTPTVNNATELFVSLDGAPQEPINAYSCTGDTLVFVTAPSADAYCYILWYHPPGAP
jgi:hypothetical protein